MNPMRLRSYSRRVTLVKPTPLTNGGRQKLSARLKSLLLGSGSRSAIIGRSSLLLAIVLALVWVLFIAAPSPASGASTWRSTTFGSAVHDPIDFLKTLLDTLTYAGLLFVVASGFTLIFGLMRVVNMAHGSFFLLAGYIGVRLQQELHARGRVRAVELAGVPVKDWILPLVIAVLVVAGIGLVVQQLLLRWNQGQELRQALITIAISLIAGRPDARALRPAAPRAWPGRRPRPRQAARDRRHRQYPWSRLFILLLALGIGLGLLSGCTRRGPGWSSAPASTTAHMVSALGINIQRTFAIAFVVGAALAGARRRDRRLVRRRRPGVDGHWLLYSLVVVIIGGMGSLGGAAIGALLLRARSATSRPRTCRRRARLLTDYSIIFTFALLVDRARGPAARAVREAGMRTAALRVRRSSARSARSCSCVVAARRR